VNKRFIRIIPKLDIKNGLLIKGINLEGLRVLGDPYKFAECYYNYNADEIYYVDNVATLYGTNNLSKFVSKTAKNIFVPLAVGGGIKSLNDIEKFLKNGADKICINSAAINNIKLVRDASRVFGSSTITTVVEALKIENKYFLTKSNGRDLVKKNPVDWAKQLEDFGSGEIFLTSINNEGIQKGFDIDITKKVSRAVSIPVIAHGGAGSMKDVYEVIVKTNISGVSLASILHYDICKNFKFKKPKIGNINFLEKGEKKKTRNLIQVLKKYLSKKGVNVRL